MAFYQFRQQQFIPAEIEEVWEFMASPENLKKITPPSMGFDITGRSRDGKMYPGMIITYNVRPLFGFPTPWMTEITQVKELEYFVDEQRLGPYRLWHHEHHMEPQHGGVLMTDVVTYAPPLGFLGRLAHKFLIRKKLKAIFDHRLTAMERYFPGIREIKNS